MTLEQHFGKKKKGKCFKCKKTCECIKKNTEYTESDIIEILDSNYCGYCSYINLYYKGHENNFIQPIQITDSIHFEFTKKDKNDVVILICNNCNSTLLCNEFKKKIK